MKNYLAGLGLLTLASLAQAQITTVLDSFSGDLGNWSSTVILNNGTAAFNTSALIISDGALTYVTSAYETNGIEQAAHIFSNQSLAIGEELQVDVGADVTGSQDIGLYVGIAPTTATGGGSTRASYVAIYKRSNEQIFTRGFAGTTEYGLAGGTTVSSATTLFISRTAGDMFEVGYYDLVNGRTIVATRTDATNTALAIGLYTDVRATGTLGSVDNFRIFNVTAIPEPSTFAALAGALALGAAAGRRRRA